MLQGSERRESRRGDSGRATGGNGGGNTTGGTAGDDDTFNGDTPPDDQYDSLVTRLMMRVGEPEFIEEFDTGP